MEQAVLKALAYFDLFEYPLTTVEVWKYVPVRVATSLATVAAALHDLATQHRVEHHDGFWVLPHRAAILATRRSRYTIAERKYRKAERAIQFLKCIPSIRMVAVANTLAWNHARDGSDIDLFVVTRPGALWKSRLFGVTPFALLGLRPQAANERDTFCFSFFAAESALDLSLFRIGQNDPYLSYWLATLVPVHDPDGLMDGVWEANQWMREHLANAWQTHPVSRRRTLASARKDVREDVMPQSSWSEQCARALQLAWLPPQLRSMMNVDGRVVVTDDVLKFHVNDRREEIAVRFENRCRELGVCD